MGGVSLVESQIENIVGGRQYPSCCQSTSPLAQRDSKLIDLARKVYRLCLHDFHRMAAMAFIF